MSLSDKKVQEFKDLMKEKYDKELSDQEAREQAEDVLGLFRLIGDISMQRQKWKEKLKDNPEGFPVEGERTCRICKTSMNESNSWYSKYGLSCVSCYKAVESGDVPSDIFEDEDSFLSKRQIRNRFDASTQTINKFVREGKLKERVIEKPEGRADFRLFLLKENPILQHLVNSELLQNRIEKFLGYGNLESDIWFVGIEEGFNGTMENLMTRLKATQNGSMFDIRRSMRDVEDHMKWFQDSANIQPTWGKIIRILLNVNEEEDIDKEQIREYQINELGDIRADHALLELLPLPSSSTDDKDWIYNQFDLDYLQTREAYEDKVLPYRIKLFQNIINEYKPKVVIFYSKRFFNKGVWGEIANCKFEETEINNLFKSSKNGVNFFSINHPGYSSNLKMKKIGKFIKSLK